jgi:IS30 family transposase
LRQPEAADRHVPGHWEADLVMFAKYGQALLTLHERTSRILLASRPKNKTADLIADIMRALLSPLPEPMRRSITFDNGTEFARHFHLHELGFDTFFCDPHAPWQKGGIENAIGRLRRTLPRKTDLATLSTERFATLLRAYNATPRKCLDFQTPAEVFLNQLLHFGCESTSRPASG